MSGVLSVCVCIDTDRLEASERPQKFVTTLPQVLLVASSIAYFRVATEAGIRPTRRADVLLWYIKP